MAAEYWNLLSGKTGLNSIKGLGWQAWMCDPEDQFEDDGPTFFVQPIGDSNDQRYAFDLGSKWQEVMECHLEYEGEAEDAIKELKEAGFKYRGITKDDEDADEEDIDPNDYVSRHFDRKITTDDCKELLVEYYQKVKREPSSKSDWSRTKKWKRDEVICRSFMNKDTGEEYELTENPDGDLRIYCQLK
jgi:hypothetical protein